MKRLFFWGSLASIAAFVIAAVIDKNTSEKTDTIEIGGNSNSAIRIEGNKGSINIAESGQTKKEDSSCEAEIDYFLHKELLYADKVINYQWFVSFYGDSWAKKGVEFSGPTCVKRNGKYIISYHAKGNFDGTILDHFADIEVDSKKDNVKPISLLAESMLGIINKP